MPIQAMLHVQWAFLKSIAYLVPVACLFFTTSCAEYSKQNMATGNNNKNRLSVSVSQEEGTNIPEVKDQKTKRKKISNKRDTSTIRAAKEHRKFLDAYKNNDIQDIRYYFDWCRGKDIEPYSNTDTYLQLAIASLLIYEAQNPSKMHLDFVKEYIACARDINTRNRPGGNAPIHAAVFHANIPLLKILLKTEGIDVNLLDKDGLAPIHRAIMHGDEDVFCLLLTAKAINVNILGTHGLSPIHRVIKKYNKISGKNNHGLLNALLSRGDIKPNIKDKDGLTPIHRAIMCGDVASCKILLNKEGIDVNVKDKNNLPLIRYLLRYYSPEIWNTCMEDAKTKIDINAKDSSGCTALHCALYYAGNPQQVLIEAVDQLLDHKDIDVNAVSNAFYTPLNALIWNKNFNKALFKKLINHENLKVDDNPKERIRPYAFAWIVGNKKAMKMLQKDQRFSTELLPMRIKYDLTVQKNIKVNKFAPLDLKDFNDLFQKLYKKVIEYEASKKKSIDGSSSIKKWYNLHKFRASV